MKELKDQIIDVFKTYERLYKKCRRLEDDSNGEIIFGYPFSTKTMQIYQGVDRMADLLDLEAVKTESGIDEFPIKTSVMIGNIKAYQIDREAEDGEMQI